MTWHRGEFCSELHCLMSDARLFLYRLQPLSTCQIWMVRQMFTISLLLNSLLSTPTSRNQQPPFSSLLTTRHVFPSLIPPVSLTHSASSPFPPEFTLTHWKLAETMNSSSSCSYGRNTNGHRSRCPRWNGSRRKKLYNSALESADQLHGCTIVAKNPCALMTTLGAVKSTISDCIMMGNYKCEPF